MQIVIGSPWDLFEETSPGYLARRHRLGRYVSSAEIDVVVKADPKNIDDPRLTPLLADLMRRKVSGRRGRPERLYTDDELRVASNHIDVFASVISEGRGRVRGRLEPRVIAANLVARIFKFHISGRALLNLISSRN